MFDSLRKLLSPHSDHATSWRMTRLLVGDDQEAVSQSLIRLAAIASQERIELAPLIENLGKEHRRASRGKLLRLARRINAGSTFIEALEQTPNLLRDEDLLSLKFASQSGTLPQAYDEMISRFAARSREHRDHVRQALSYAVALSIAFFLLIAFQMTFIAPTFKQMFSEFGLRLPASLRSLIGVTDFLAQFLPLLMLLGAIALALTWLLKPIRALHRRLGSRIFPSVAQLRRSQLLRMLALSSDAGRPIPGSLSTLARNHFDPGLRLKLLVARNEVEQGTDTWRSLQEANLLSEAEASAFANASSPELRSWAMRRLAQQKEDGVVRKNTVLTLLLHPAIVLVFGAITLWVTSAFFSVLISMISSLS